MQHVKFYFLYAPSTFSGPWSPQRISLARGWFFFAFLMLIKKMPVIIIEVPRFVRKLHVLLGLVIFF